MPNPNSYVLLIGNGFNKYLARLAVENKFDGELIKELDNIAYLWRNFDNLIDELRKNLATKLGSSFENMDGEDILFIIYEVISFLHIISKMNNHSNSQECLTLINEILNDEIIKKIYELVKNFLSQEISNFYKRLKDAFIQNNLLTNSFLEYLQDLDINVFTTNYEGLIDVLFSPKGFWLEDDFNSCEPSDKDFLCFCPKFSSNRHKLFHIHGSYKFFEKEGETYKLRTTNKRTDNKEQISELLGSIMSRIINENYKPVLIYSSFQYKQKFINKNPLLSYYFNYLRDRILNANNIIIFGMKLANDKHIVEAILSPPFFSQVLSDGETQKYIKTNLYIIDRCEVLEKSETYNFLKKWGKELEYSNSEISIYFSLTSESTAKILSKRKRRIKVTENGKVTFKDLKVEREFKATILNSETFKSLDEFAKFIKNLTSV